MICLGLEGTAEKTGVGIVDSEGEILASVGRSLIPPSGGIHPREAAEHHAENLPILIKDALNESCLNLEDLELVAFSKGPGLGPALRTVATAARTLSLSLNVPLIGVNHCVGHIEIGRLTTGAEDPLTLYVSGGNTQVIAYDDHRYRVFGETLDIAIGNCLDQFARNAGMGHPGGPLIEKLALKKTRYLDLPYTVKGMDLSFSGLLTAATRKYENGCAVEDVCYSLQETAFSMLVEITERALAHSKKKEVLLVGGVAANQRLKEMISTMAKEHFTDFFIPPTKYCGDNGAMIAWLGILMSQHGVVQDLENSKIIQRFRTDEVDLPWMRKSEKTMEIPQNLTAKGAEADIYPGKWMDYPVLIKERIPKNYRIVEIDKKLRAKRNKKEAKLLNEAKKAGVRTPLLYDIDIMGTSLIMEKIDGHLIKDIFNQEMDKIEVYSENIGENIAKLHKHGIIHGDLTTSNMILKDDELVFIDFGLGKISYLIEDKGVDLLVLKKALIGIHHNIATIAFNNIMKGYQYAEDHKEVADKVQEIEERRRYT